MKIQKLFGAVAIAALFFATSCKKSETVETKMDEPAVVENVVVEDTMPATKMVGGAEMLPLIWYRKMLLQV